MKSTSMPLRISFNLLNQLKEIAEQKNISLQALTRYGLEQFVQNFKDLKGEEFLKIKITPRAKDVIRREIGTIIIDAPEISVQGDLEIDVLDALKRPQ